MIDPITRREKYLAKMAGSNIVTPKPITREEMFLDKAAENAASGGGVSSWNDLTDKPFGEETVGGDTLTWDGNTDGLVSVMGTMYRVADNILTIDDVANGMIMAFSGGASQTVGGEELRAIYEQIGIIGYGYVYFVPTDNFELSAYGESVVFPKAGVYLNGAMDGGSAYVESLTIPGYTGFETTTVKTIDPKYLGGWEAMGSKYENGVVFSGSDFPLVPYTVSDDLNINMFLISERFTLTEGKEYTVNWNGTDYTCVCERMQLGGATGNSVGNIAALTGTGNTGEPFVLGVFDEAFGAGGIEYPASAVPLDGSTTLTLSITGEIEHITPVPPKYLPGGFGSVVEEGVVLAECSPTIVDTGDGMYLFPLPALSLVEGGEYTVNWNGTPVTCTCSFMDLDGVTGLGLGNIGAMTDGVTTGEPFVLVVFDDLTPIGVPAAAVPLDGSTTLPFSSAGIRTL